VDLALSSPHICLPGAFIPTPGSSRLITGVTMAFLRDLPSVVMGLADGALLPEELTTEQLVYGQSARNATGPGPLEWCIARTTEKDRCCFIEWCELAGLTVSADGSPYFAPVTHFVSHAWHANFPRLVATLELYAGGKDGDDGAHPDVPAEKAAWFLDIFSINQHVPPWLETPPRGYDEVLKPPIAVCGRTVLVLQPWENPVSFTRAWCLFEIMTTLEEGATLDVALSLAERGRFVQTLTEDFDEIMNNISNIDARKATATVLEDRDAIFKLIELGKGFGALNDSIMSAIRAWLVEAADVALAGVKGSYGAVSIEVAQLLHPIGMLYDDQGRYEKSLEAYGSALGLYRKLLGEEHPSTAMTVNNMANVYSSQGRYDLALEAYGSALEVQIKTLGEGHPNVALTLGGMANVYGCQGRHEEALEAYQRVLEVLHKTLGEEHPDTASTLNNMGIVYAGQGRHEEALEVQSKALEVQSKALGEEHPKTAATLVGLANVKSSQGCHDVALEMYGRALEVQIKVLGEAHTDAASTYGGMANVYAAQGRHEEALEAYERVMEVQHKALGYEHPSTASTLNNMAMVYGNQGRHDVALEMYGRALKAYSKALGEEHPEFAGTLFNMAGAYDHDERHHEALEMYGRALEVQRKALGEAHTDTATTLYNMGDVYERQERYTEAAASFDYAGDVYANVYGDEHDETLDARERASTMIDRLE